MRRELDAVEVVANGRRERCCTSVQTASASVVTLISVLESRAVTLASAHLETIGGVHLRLAPGQPTVSMLRPIVAMAGEAHLRACVLEHASELRDFLEEVGRGQARVEVVDVALEQAAAVWRDAASHC